MHLLRQRLLHCGWLARGSAAVSGDALAAHLRDCSGVIKVVVRQLRVETEAVLRVAHNQLVLIVAVGQVVRVKLEKDGKHQALSPVVHVKQQLERIR